MSICVYTGVWPDGCVWPAQYIPWGASAAQSRTAWAADAALLDIRFTPVQNGASSWQTTLKRAPVR